MLLPVSSVVLHSAKASSVPALQRHWSPRGVATIAWRHWRESAARPASLEVPLQKVGRLELSCASQIKSHRMMLVTIKFIRFVSVPL